MARLAMSLRSPAAEELLTKLRIALQQAREAIPIAGDDLTFAAEVSRIPQIVDDLQKFLPPRTRKFTVFWNRVRAVEHERPSLRIRQTLQALYARASCRIPPGPLARMLAKNRPISETKLLRELIDRIESSPTGALLDADRYAKLLAEVGSPLQTKLLQMLSSTPVPRERRAVAMIQFLDLYWQQRSWRDQYERIVINLYDLAVILEHQPFLNKLRPLLFQKTDQDNYFDVEGWVRSRRVKQRNKRQKNYRDKHNTKSAKKFVIRQRPRARS